MYQWFCSQRESAKNFWWILSAVKFSATTSRAPTNRKPSRRSFISSLSSREQRVELAHRILRAVGMFPHAGRHRQEVRASVDKNWRVLDRDAANGHTWHHHHLAPPAQQLDVRLGLGFFGLGREEGAKGDIVGAGLARLHGQVPAVMTGDADDAAGQQPPRLGVGGILLADMDAVAAQFGGKVGPVVQDEGSAGRLYHGAQRIHRAADFLIADVLQAQLERGDIAAFQRFLEGPQKIRRREPRRRNQVKSAAVAHAAFFSSASFHLPSAASEFIRARWAKAAWPLPTFSALPLQAFCGAACRARP